MSNDASIVVCWCGLSHDHHDGREMDLEGNMHRFNEPVKKLSDDVRPVKDYEETPTVNSSDKVSVLLHDVKKFLHVEIISIAQSGSKKFPLQTVNRTSTLIRKIDEYLKS